VNLLAQHAALAAIQDKAFLQKTLSHVNRERDFLYRAFDRLGLRHLKSASNFVIVDVGKDCKEVFAGLLRQGVIVRDMKAWGFDAFIRVTIGTRSENKRFIKALKDVL
jgi:histidinol-phosphate aminotransferase